MRNKNLTAAAAVATAAALMLAGCATQKPAASSSEMGNFEQTFENTYDDNGNLVSMKSTYNGDDGYFIDYIYAALNDASYNGEGTLLFDTATDTPSAA